MSIHYLVDAEISRVKRGTIKQQLWKLREVLRVLTNECNEHDQLHASRALYDVVVSTEWLEKELDVKRTGSSRWSRT